MGNFKLITTLVLSQLWHSPWRGLLAVLGIMASTCAVIWVVSGYDALVLQLDKNAQKYLGRYDALIVPQAPSGTVQTINPKLIDSLRQDLGVLELNPVNQTRVTVTRVLETGESPGELNALTMLIGDRPPVYGAPPVDPVLVSTPARDSPYEMVDGEWLSSDASQTADSNRSVVLGIKAAEKVGADIGDEIQITSIANRVQLRVIGIVDQPDDEPVLRGPGGVSPPVLKIEAGPVDPEPGKDSKLEHPKMELPAPWVAGPAVNAVYVRPQVAEQINGFAPQANVLQISLRDGVTAEDFRNVWNTRLASSNPPVKVVVYGDIRVGMESTWTLDSQRTQAWTAAGMASFAATFIIFAVLSMGVSERIRELAMLRAIALTRFQIAAMIVVESLVLAVTGWTAGLLAGQLTVTAGSWHLPSMFAANAKLGPSCAILSAVTVLVGGSGAAIVPAWRALRIAPLDGLHQALETPNMRWVAPLALIGMLLCVSAPISVFLLPLSDTWRPLIYSFVTWPALVVGTILVCPGMIVIGERLLGGLFCRLLSVEPDLAQWQLSGNLWRSTGATLALSLGLGLYCSAQIWGHSMLQPFLPGQWAPDALVAFHPLGLRDDELELVEQVDGVESDSVMPLAVEQAQFHWPGDDKPGGVQYDNAVLFGIEPHRAFDREQPGPDPEFVLGNREQAIAALDSGEGCIVSQDFHQLTGIGIGDELSFRMPDSEKVSASYQVSAIVALPGWHWLTKFSGVRRNSVRTATMIFVNRESAAEKFGLVRTEYCWLNLTPEASLEQVEQGLQAIAERDAGASFQTAKYGAATAYRPFARLTATNTVRKAIKMTANSVFQEMSQLPLITLVIMSLAVANAMVASVRSRNWEFAVMRSIGLTRWELVRLILVEAILIGSITCLISSLFGLIGGWCGVEMARFGRWFAGPSNFVIPWQPLLLGYLFTIGICLAAAVIPAIRTGFSQPLILLQKGRSAM